MSVLVACVVIYIQLGVGTVRAVVRMCAVVVFSLASTVVNVSVATADDIPWGSEAHLISADGSSIALPSATSVASETLNGVTTTTIMWSAGVPQSMLTIDDELTPPDPTDLLVPANDPLAPATGLEPPADEIGDDELRQCQPDSSYSIQVCLKMTYSSYTSGSKRYVRLLSYMHRWIRMDSSVAWSGAFSRAGVLGYSPSGQHYAGSVTKQIGTPASNDTVYTHKPSWTGVDIDVNRWKAYQAANNEITLRRGGSTWTFVHANVGQGSVPSPQ